MNIQSSETSLQMLKEQVYPTLYEGLIKLIDHIVKTDEIRKHQERLKRKKVFDKLEQKRVERERLKAELGSEYESSEDESMDYEELGIDKEEFEQIKNEHRGNMDDHEDEDQDKNDQKDKQKMNDKLDAIVENEELENEDEDTNLQRQLMKEQLQHDRESRVFNPLSFLANQIRILHEEKKQSQN